jgi:Family of unknown function (DUF6116)
MKRVLPSALVNGIVGWFLSYASRLKHPQLFKWISVLFLVDLIIPDLVPFVDEVLLGLATLFLASWKRSHKEMVEAQKPVTEKPVKGTAEKITGNEPESRQKYGKH